MSKLSTHLRGPSFGEALAGVFTLAVALGVLETQADVIGVDATHLALLARLALATVLLLFGAWFISAFVTADLHEYSAAKMHDMYRFAYTFMLVGLALLVLPFTAMHRIDSTPDSGPIRVINGCVQPPAASAVRASAAPAASAASAPSLFRQSPVPSCDDAAKADSYPLLVVVGGVLARSDSGRVLTPEGMASQPTRRNPAHAVTGGLVVPLYLIVLGFIGGAISLARKIPEYHKRAEPGFAGTTKELPLQPGEAREFVVFQVLQLVTSPFIAILAFYLLEPRDIAVAIGQAFFAGFASEWILLRVRTVVDGPGLVPTVATTNTHGQLAVTVKDASGAVPALATVKLSLTSGGPSFAVDRTDGNGKCSFPSVTLGTVWIEATAGALRAGPMNYTVGAGSNAVPLIVT